MFIGPILSVYVCHCLVLWHFPKCLTWVTRTSCISQGHFWRETRRSKVPFSYYFYNTRSQGHIWGWLISSTRMMILVEGKWMLRFRIWEWGVGTKLEFSLCRVPSLCHLCIHLYRLHICVTFKYCETFLCHPCVHWHHIECICGSLLSIVTSSVCHPRLYKKWLCHY